MEENTHAYIHKERGNIDIYMYEITGKQNVFSKIYNSFFKAYERLKMKLIKKKIMKIRLEYEKMNYKRDAL